MEKRGYVHWTFGQVPNDTGHVRTCAYNPGSGTASTIPPEDFAFMHTNFQNVFELRLSAVKPLRCSAGKHITNRSTHIVKNNCIVGSSRRLHRTHNSMYAPQLQRVKYIEQQPRGKENGGSIWIDKGLGP